MLANISDSRTVVVATPTILQTTDSLGHKSPTSASHYPCIYHLVLLLFFSIHDALLSQTGGSATSYGQSQGIGKHPTPSRSSLLVLLFGFSLIETSEYLRESFHRTLNRFLRTFLVDNARFLGHPDPSTVIQDGDAAESMARVFVSKCMFPLSISVPDRSLVEPGTGARRDALCGH